MCIIQRNCYKTGGKLKNVLDLDLIQLKLNSIQCIVYFIQTRILINLKCIITLYFIKDEKI